MTKVIDADELNRVNEESIAEYGADYYTGEMIYGMRMVCQYAVEQAPTVDAVPVSFIESEIKRADDDINTAMNDGETEWAERAIVRKTTLEFVLAKWRSEREEE